MKITPTQADALAKLLLTIRPDWSKHYTADAVAQMRFIDDDLERLVTAAVRGALSPKIAKPDVLAMTGEHWRPPAAEHHTTRGPRIAVTSRCGECGALHATDAPCQPRGDDMPAAAARGLAEARAELARARDGLCSHGIPHHVCRDPHDTEEPQP